MLGVEVVQVSSIFNDINVLIEQKRLGAEQKKHVCFENANMLKRNWGKRE